MILERMLFAKNGNILKFQVMTQSKCIGELIEFSEWMGHSIVLTHINIKHTQSAQFQADLEILRSTFYKLILQWVTLVSIKMKYWVTCGAARVSWFSLQHWPVNQHINVGHKYYSSAGHHKQKNKRTTIKLNFWQSQ